MHIPCRPSCRHVFPQYSPPQDCRILQPSKDAKWSRRKQAEGSQDLHEYVQNKEELLTMLLCTRHLPDTFLMQSVHCFFEQRFRGFSQLPLYFTCYSSLLSLSYTIIKSFQLNMTAASWAHQCPCLIPLLRICGGSIPHQVFKTSPHEGAGSPKVLPPHDCCDTTKFIKFNLRPTPKKV